MAAAPAVTTMLADDRLPDGLRFVGADEGLPALPETRWRADGADPVWLPATGLGRLC